MDEPVSVRPIPDKLSSTLTDILQRYVKLADEARRAQVKRIRKARNFMDGIQHVVWNDSLGDYQDRTSTLGSDGQPQPSGYVINYYRAYQETIASLGASAVPTLKAFPESPQSLLDIEAANSADAAMRLFARTNKLAEKLRFMWYYHWTDGAFGTYVRYAQDGERLGYEVVQQNQVMPVDIAGTMTELPQPTSMAVAKGAEIIDVVPALELKLPPYTKELHQFPYLIWELEVPREMLMAAYPHAAAKLVGASSTANGIDDEGRRVREEVAAGVTAGRSRIGYRADGDSLTFRRVWLRSWVFHSVKDEQLRIALMTAFPRGLYMAVAGDVVCDVRPESMDDHWRICHAVTRDGQIRSSQGDPLIECQELANDATNIERDISEFTIPMMFADPQTIDANKITGNRAIPGAIYQAKRKSGDSLSQSFYETKPAQMPIGLPQFRAWLAGDAMQMLSGAHPAAYGGDLGGNITATGISIERDQAMGRIGINWGNIKQHLVEISELACNLFKRRGGPVNVAGDARTASAVADPAKLRAGNYRIEALEDFPTTWPQRRNTLMAIAQNPGLAPILSYPGNQEEVRRILGVTSLIFPGSDAWKKQLKEIEMLLQQPPGMGPMGPISSISVIPFLEDNQTELEAIRWWIATDEGQRAKYENPMGYANVVAHANEHAMAAAPAMPAGPENSSGPQQNAGSVPSKPPDRMEQEGYNSAQRQPEIAATQRP